VQLDDWVLCRIDKKTSHEWAMAVPPLFDHEQDEPCGFDETPYTTSSSAAGMILQGVTPAGAFSMMQQQGAAGGTQWMPRIPSISELLNDYSLAQLFSDQQQHHATPSGRVGLLPRVVFFRQSTPSLPPHPAAAAVPSEAEVLLPFPTVLFLLELSR
jgi:hypothetical protein